MSALLTILFLALLFIQGLLLSKLLGIRNALESLGLSFILSSLWITVTVILVNQYLALTISPILFFGLLSTSLLIFSLFYYVRYKKALPLSSSWMGLAQLRTFNKLEKTVFLIIFSLILGSAIQNVFWPVTDWDALALYDFRARVVAETGSFESGWDLGYFFQYPPYTSLLHTSLYQLDFMQVKIWYSILYASFIAVFYSMLRKRTSRTISMMGALLLATNPFMVEHSVMAYTNLAYTMFLSLGIIYLWEWHRSDIPSYLIIGSILVGGSTWVRMSEPFWMIAIALILYGFATKKRSLSLLVKTVISLLFILGIKAIWPDFVANLPKPDALESVAKMSSASVLQSPPSQYLKPLLSVFNPLSALLGRSYAEIQNMTLNVGSYFWYYIFPVFSYLALPSLIIIFYDIKKGDRQPLLMWGTILILLALIFLGTLIFSFSFETWDQIGGSAQRMSLFLIPLIIFSLAASSLWQKFLQK
jgi:hypothetical protein